METEFMVERPRRRKDDVFMINLPWWVRAVAQVGAPILASGYLLWFTTTKVSDALDTVAESLRDHATQSSSWATRLDLESRDQAAERAEIVKILEVICYSVADNAPNDRRRREECRRREATHEDGK
jgi:hypothetical protein